MAFADSTSHGRAMLLLLLSVFLLVPGVSGTLTPGSGLHYKIYEEVSLDTLIGDVGRDAHIQGAVTSQHPQVVYNLLSDSDPLSAYLRLDKTGRLFTYSLPDREDPNLCPRYSTCILHLDVAVRDMLGSFFTTIPVEIEVLDINDNPPMFPKSAIALSVSEMASVGAVLYSGLVTDDDTGNNTVKQCYSKPDSSSVPFNISLNISLSSPSGNHVYSLFLTRPLDREAVNYYRLAVVCVDGGQPRLSGTSTIDIRVTDENDNAPVFSQSQYTLQVTENALRGTVIGRVRATDVDSGSNGRLSYHLQHGGFVPFTVGRDSGDIETTRVLDREIADLYQFSVVAVDNGSPPKTGTARVKVTVIDVNDNVPFFVFPSPANQTVKLPVSSVAGTLVTKVTALDADQNATVLYSLHGTNLPDLFRVENDNGIGKIRLVRALSPMEPLVYSLQITASDGLHQVVTKLTVQFTAAQSTVSSGPGSSTPSTGPSQSPPTRSSTVQSLTSSAAGTVPDTTSSTASPYMTTPPPCADRLPDCARLNHLYGVCRVQKKALLHCVKTCDLCGMAGNPVVASPPPCVDGQPNCGELHEMYGLCEVLDRAVVHCAKTCGMCWTVDKHIDPSTIVG